MCRRFIPIDCDEVARIAAEMERDLAAHANELASLDPIGAYGLLPRIRAAGPRRAASETRRRRTALAVRRRIGRAGKPAEPARSAARTASGASSSVVPLIVAAGDGCGLAAHMAWGTVPRKNGPVQHAHRDGSAQRGQHVGGVLRASSLPGACSGLLQSHATETVPSSAPGAP
ncbi:MAG: hypothetical protein ACLT98_17825 [Eggerthellaceae bacterium]